MRNNFSKLALDKNLSYLIYKQWNNNPIFQVLDLVSKKCIYRGKSRHKAISMIINF